MMTMQFATRKKSKKIFVEFESMYDSSIGWNDPYNISPYINMAHPEERVKGQKNPDEIVIPMNTIRVMYDYPLKHTVVYTITSDTPQGFTRKHLALEIARGYQNIYKEEEEAVGNPGHIPGLFNRKTSFGPHGIRDHDLEDLVLHGVKQTEQDSDLFRLLIDS